MFLTSEWIGICFQEDSVSFQRKRSLWINRELFKSKNGVLWFSNNSNNFLSSETKNDRRRRSTHNNRGMFGIGNVVCSFSCSLPKFLKLIIESDKIFWKVQFDLFCWKENYHNSQFVRFQVVLQQLIGFGWKNFLMKSKINTLKFLNKQVEILIWTLKYCWSEVVIARCGSWSLVWWVSSRIFLQVRVGYIQLISPDLQIQTKLFLGSVCGLPFVTWVFKNWPGMT